MRKLIFVFTISLLAVLMLGCASEQKQAVQQTGEKVMTENVQGGEKVAVAIKGFKFIPQDITVKVGTTVTWTNEDSAPHTVESSDGVLRSDELGKGDSWSFTFTKAGKHDYICGIHPSMHGSVTVQ